MKLNSLAPVAAGLVLCVLNAQAQSVPFLTNGLVAYYPFSGNADDASGNGNNGTAYNISYVADRFGIPNAAAYFSGNGNSYIEIDSTNLNLQPPFTVSLWLNPTVGTSEGPRVISSSGYEITCDSPTTDYSLPTRYMEMNFTTTSGLGGSSVESTNAVTVNNWTHAVGIWQSNQISIYVNGALSGTLQTTVTPGYSRGTNTLVGAMFGSSSSGFFSGAMQDIALYDRALTTNEITQLYQYQSAPFVGLALYVQPTFYSLSVGTNYQLQTTTDLITWANSGTPFIALSNTFTYSQYFNVSNWNSLYFRLTPAP